MAEILSLTQSQFGFISELFSDADGKPYLKTHAISNIAWNEETLKFYNENVSLGLEFHNMNTLFGAVITTGQPVISNDPINDPRSAGLPKGHPPLESFLGLPFYSGKKIIGMVGIANRPNGYDEKIIDYLQPFLGTCGNILQDYRNAEKRKLAEEKMLKMQKQLRNLSNKLQSAREEDKAHMAREIHDEFGQTLTALKLDLSWLKNNLKKNETHLIDKINVMNHLIENTVQMVQRVASDLHPRILDLLGLCKALKWHTKEFQKRTRIECELTIIPENIELDPERSITLFRIYQEALTNVIRHSKANRVKSIFAQQKDQLVLEVSDNGIGMCEEEMENPKSFGLIGIRERVFVWGGETQILSKEGNGTTIRVTIPWNQA
jgi:signal transduction histidine kinase